MATKPRVAAGSLRPWEFLALLIAAILTATRADLDMQGWPGTFKLPQSEQAFVALHPGDLELEFLVTPKRTYTRYALNGEYYFFIDKKLVLRSRLPLPKLP